MNRTRTTRRRALCTALMCLLASGAGVAQFSVPEIKLTPIDTPAPLVLMVPVKALIQPAAIEARLTPGFSVVNLNFSVIADVPAEVTVEASDPRLLLRLPGGKLRLEPHTLMSVSGLASGAHEGMIRVRNSRGEVIAEAPYRIGDPRRISQNASLNYSPDTNQISASYSAGLQPSSIFSPRLSSSLSLSVNPSTGQVSGNVGINVSW